METDSVVTENRKHEDFMNLLKYLEYSRDDHCKELSSSCSQVEYAQKKIFPILLPAINEMLSTAGQLQVFEKRRSSFNACDFITEYLFNNNPRHKDRPYTELWDIPFVRRINIIKPRPPLPLSLIWSDEEAALVIQSYWRGYLVRRQPDVQELREYQKEMRQESYDIMFRVEDFWKKHPVQDDDDINDDDVVISADDREISNLNP